VIFKYVLFVLLGLLAMSAIAESDPLDIALDFHGGIALTKMQTYAEDYAVVASFLGAEVSQFRVRFLADFEQRKLRVEYLNNGKVFLLAQQTPQGTWLWSGNPTRTGSAITR
jgi:hypothetical protein